MVANPPDGSPADSNGERRPDPADRIVGRASVPAPRATEPASAEDSERAAKDPYEPRAYRSRAYRGRPFQDRPMAGPAPRRLGLRWGRLAIVASLLVGLVVACGAFGAYLWLRGVDDNLRREDPFAGLESRPSKLAGGAINVLMLGSDSRDPEIAGESGPARTDTIVVLHIPASHDRAYLVSLPRDLWVHIPRSADGRHGDTMAKINAAYAWGETPLVVETVEAYTGVRMDHVVMIDFAGFVRVTDAVGGVDMEVEQTITSIHPPYRTFPAGPAHFNGEEALDYVRQRYQFRDGDFARMRHQQMFLKALLDKAASLGTLSNLGALRNFVTSIADTMVVDQDFSLVDLGWQLRGLRGGDLVFLVSPNKGTGTVGDQSVVFPDPDRAGELYDAMARDQLDEWVSVHGSGP